MKIALVGSAGSVYLAPYEDATASKFRQGMPVWPPPAWEGDNWEIWACSPGAAGALRRCTRFFEVHRWEPGQPWFTQGYCQFLRDFKGPVYVGAGVLGGRWEDIPLEAIPNKVPFPLERVEETFSSYFLSSTLPQMFALAILEIEDYRAAHPDHDPHEDVIGFWGVDMAAGEEWEWQRPGCQFFMLEALRRGIGVYTPPESCLMRPLPVYGMCEWQPNYIKATQRMREINQKMSQAQRQLQEAQAQVHACAGAIEDVNYFTKTWMAKDEHSLKAGKFERLRDDVLRPELNVPLGFASRGYRSDSEGAEPV